MVGKFKMIWIRYSVGPVWERRFSLTLCHSFSRKGKLVFSNDENTGSSVLTSWWHPIKHSYSFSFGCSPSRNTVPLIIFNYSDSLLFFQIQKNYWIELFVFGFVSILVTLSPYYILYCAVQNPSFLNSFKCLVSNFEIDLTDPLNNFFNPEFLLWTCTPWSFKQFL